MKFISLERVSFFLAGVVATGAVMVLDRHNDQKKVFDAMSLAIEEGQFCPADAQEAEIMKEEVRETYFVGCGGFF